MTTATAPAKAACRKCGSTQLEPRGDVLRRELAGIDEATGREFVAVEWLPVKCADCGQYRKIKTYVEAKPTKRPAPPRARKQKSAPTFAQTVRTSAEDAPPLVTIPAVTQAADYSTAPVDAQQSSQDPRPKRNSRRRRD
jgi:ribosomal protein S27E